MCDVEEFRNLTITVSFIQDLQDSSFKKVRVIVKRSYKNISRCEVNKMLKVGHRELPRTARGQRGPAKVDVSH